MSVTKTQTLSLGEYWNAFIAEQVEKGRYASASELVRDGLRLLERQQTDDRLNVLRAVLLEGEQSGDAGALDMEDIRRSAKQEMGL